MKTLSILSTMVAVLFFVTAAQADQYPVLDPGYAQQIYTGALVLNQEAGMAWTSGGNLLTRAGSNIIEYSPTQNAVHQGTNVHGVLATHSIPGLNTSGYGMTNGLDGYVYTVTGSGLQRFDPSNWAAPAQTLANTVGGAGYGITTLPDGRIAYSDGSGSSSVWVYTPNANPNLGTNVLVYSTNFLIDGMVAGPTGAIALAGQSNSSISIISSSGSLIQSFSTPHYPDGMAFGDNPSSGTLYSNNNDGTISKYVLGPGYTGTPVISDIATGSGAYGDLASVGPDCAFYVTQSENGGYHGCTPGVGTNWNLGTNAEGSITRIAEIGPDGTELCGFYSAFVPEPGALSLLGLGALALLRRRRK